MRQWMLLLLLISSATPALAVDGVLEINQTCAVQTGCFAGDTAGYPVTISAAGSYRLTSNLSVFQRFGETQDLNFVEIAADDVTLDLGGFRISCRTSLGGTCTGSGSGVASESPARYDGTAVKNGSIIGMADRGVLLQDRSEVSHLRVSGNGHNGIQVGAGSTVSGNTANQNAFAGIVAGSGSTVSGNTAYQNGDDGINVVAANVSGNTAAFNLGDGISAVLTSSVSGNMVSENEGYGLLLGNFTGYHDNTIVINTLGTVLNGVNGGGNVCNSNTTCP